MRALRRTDGVRRGGALMAPELEEAAVVGAVRTCIDRLGRKAWLVAVLADLQTAGVRDPRAAVLAAWRRGLIELARCDLPQDGRWRKMQAGEIRVDNAVFHLAAVRR